MEEEGELRTLYEFFFWSIKALPSKMTTAWRVLADRLPIRVNMEKKRVRFGKQSLCYVQGRRENK